MLPHLSHSSHIYKDLHIKYLLCSQRVNSLKGRLTDSLCLCFSFCCCCCLCPHLCLWPHCPLVSGLFASLDSLLSFVSLAVSVSVSVSALAVVVVVAVCGLVLVFPLRVQKYLKSNNYMCLLCVRSAMAALLLRFVSAASYLKPCDCCVLLPTPSPPLPFSFPSPLHISCPSPSASSFTSHPLPTLPRSVCGASPSLSATYTLDLGPNALQSLRLDRICNKDIC